MAVEVLLEWEEEGGAGTESAAAVIAEEIDRDFEDVAVGPGYLAALAGAYNLEKDILGQVLRQRPVLDPAQEKGHQRTLETSTQLGAQLLRGEIVGSGCHGCACHTVACVPSE